MGVPLNLSWLFGRLILIWLKARPGHARYMERMGRVKAE
jgi:hypothetical protein